jgi:hypothetical protein
VGVGVVAEVGSVGSVGFLGGYLSLSSRSVNFTCAKRCLRLSRFVGSLQMGVKYN